MAMETKYIDIDGYWGILVIYDYTMLDWDDMWAIMRSLGMSDKNAKEAIRTLSRVNTGMTVSNEKLRMSAIFISESTSSSEFWSTAIHEARHASDAIIEYYGADWEEDAAYTTGYITKRMVELLGEPCY